MPPTHHAVIMSGVSVVGSSGRYNSAGSALGLEAWLYDGSTTKAISPTGGVYDWTNTGTGGGTVRNAYPVQLNAAGNAIGASSRINTLGSGIGTDAWIYNGATTNIIGLTGAWYEYTYGGGGGGTYRNGAATFLNPSGQVMGMTLRFNASGTGLGQDAWQYDGSSTKQIGLLGSGYEYTSSGTGGGTFRSSRPSQINASGQVAGNSNRYNASGNALGKDAWLYDGSATKMIGLTGSGYEYTYQGAGGGIFRSETAYQINDAGQVMGFGTRYSAAGVNQGQSGWFYDGTTTTALSFNTYTMPEYLSSTGVVLGMYGPSSSLSDPGQRAFAWSESSGFSDLGGLVNGGLSLAGWQSLGNVYGASGTTSGGWPSYIFGTGSVTGQTSGQSAYLLSAPAAVPEPTSLGLLSIGAISQARRFRRRKN